jgi:glycosyltransferase involved in cell wall biosynthesis
MLNPNPGDSRMPIKKAPTKTDRQQMDFSIIVPAYNAEKTLDSCLQALFSQSVPRDRYDVIVVDDGSTDATAGIVSRYPAVYHFQENQGPAAARNKGAGLAQGDIILFTDADCVPDHHWLAQMTAPFFEKDQISGVKGAYRTRQTSVTARFAQAEFQDRFDLLKKSRFIDMVDTYSAAFKKEVFLEAGGFDPFFPVANNEDTELSYRLVSMGHRLVFNPRAFVWHTHPDTLKKYLRVKFWRGYWRMVVYTRYPGKAVKDTYTPLVIKIQTLLLLGTMGMIPMALVFRSVPLYWIGVLPAAALLSSLPFSVKVFRHDRFVGLLSPVYCLFRAVVFAAGTCWGLLCTAFEKICYSRFGRSAKIN